VRPQDKPGPAARWRGGEYELLNFTEDALYVLRDASGDVTATEGDPDVVEIRCERCGRWSRNAIPVGDRDRWVCADRDCYDKAEEGDAS
jgi:hypothetical protein